MSAPQIGDIITTAEELDALSDWSAVADAHGDVAQKLPGGRWFYPDSAPISSTKAAKYGPVTILYFPGQPPRPERVVKAEALREYRSALLDARLNPGSQVTRELEFLADLLAERADRIERGEL